MGLSYSYDGEIVMIRAQGEYSTAELREAVLRSLDDPRAPPQPVMLCDMRESVALEHRSSAEVQDMARFFASLGQRYNHRLAIVARSDAAFGLMRLGSVFSTQGGAVTAVFRDMAEARGWLRSNHPSPAF